MTDGRHYQLVRSAGGPIFRSCMPEWLNNLMLRPPLIGRVQGPEDEQSILFADRLREFTLMGKLRAVWTHIPHEVGGKAKNAAIYYSLAKALGLIKGSADYVFTWNGGGCWIEMKRAKRPATEIRAAGSKGTLTPEQKAFRDWCGMLDVPHHVIYSAAEGFELLRNYGVLDHE